MKKAGLNVICVQSGFLKQSEKSTNFVGQGP